MAVKKDLEALANILEGGSGSVLQAPPIQTTNNPANLTSNASTSTPATTVPTTTSKAPTASATSAAEATPTFSTFNTSDKYNELAAVNEALKKAGYTGTAGSAAALDKYNSIYASRPDANNIWSADVLNDYNTAASNINNREKFSYDLNGDMLYQQYKNQYINAGKLAMNDTIATASAMTGGYGNSYAATAGNQAYQSYLNQLNDKVPELYNLALSKYNSEGDELLTRYNLAKDRYDDQYNQYSDKLTQWNKDLAAAKDDYEYEDTTGYNRWSDTIDRNDSDLKTMYNQEYGDYETKLAAEQAVATAKASASSTNKSSYAYKNLGFSSLGDMETYLDTLYTSKGSDYVAQYLYDAVMDGIMDAEYAMAITDFLDSMHSKKASNSQGVSVATETPSIWSDTTKKEATAANNAPLAQNVSNTRTGTASYKVDGTNEVKNIAVEYDPELRTLADQMAKDRKFGVKGKK